MRDYVVTANLMRCAYSPEATLTNLRHRHHETREHRKLNTLNYFVYHSTTAYSNIFMRLLSPAHDDVVDPDQSLESSATADSRCRYPLFLSPVGGCQVFGARRLRKKKTIRQRMTPAAF